MNKKIFIRIGIFYMITVILGTLSHFAFDKLNVDNIFKVIFPINESIFEHLKLFFFPFMFTSIIEGYLYNEKLDYFIAKRGFIISFVMLFEIIYISIITNLIGNNAFVDISSYYLLILICYFLSLYLKEENKAIKIGGYINIFIWLIAFSIFSYIPPQTRIFIDQSK